MGLGQSYLQFVCFHWVMAGFVPSLGTCFCRTSKINCLGEFSGFFFVFNGLFWFQKSLPRSQKCLSRLFSPTVQFWTKISFSFIVTRPTKCSEIHLVVTSAYQMLLGSCFSLPSTSWCQQSSCLLSLWFNFFLKKKKRKDTQPSTKCCCQEAGNKSFPASVSIQSCFWHGKLQQSLSHPLNNATLCTTAHLLT